MTRVHTNRIARRLRQRRNRRSGPVLAILLALLALMAGGSAALLALGAVAAGAGLSVALGAYGAYAAQLPDPVHLTSRETFNTAQIFDREGNLLKELWDPRGGHRTKVNLSSVSPAVVQATLAVEDPGFFANPGFDARAIGRAAIQNLLGRGSSGASTITMQLARNTLLDAEERYERTLERKVKEVLLAWRISQEFTKEQVLEMYLNEISYGNHSYGIEAAAQNYFGKNARDLTLAEATMLAGLPQSPALLNPLRNRAAAAYRQQDVVRLMVQHGFLPADQAEAVLRTPLQFVAPVEVPINAPHWVVFIQDYLERRYGRELYRRGMRVTTTLDPRLQRIAVEEVRAGVERNRRLNGGNGALVAIRPETGEVLAMVGSANYYDARIDGQVNMAVARRQPGSAFKPITYLGAFLKDWAPATTLWDVPTTFPAGAGQPPYRPRNFDGKFSGPVTIRSALARSLNVPAVQTIRHVGVAETIQLAHRLGITDLDRGSSFYGLSLTLGGGEVKLLDLTYVYATFANLGAMRGVPVPPAERRRGFRELDPVYVLKVTDYQGNVIDEFTRPREVQVVAPEYVYLVTDVLADNQARIPAFGNPNPLTLPGRPVAAKTGTTDDNRDNWAIGYTPDLVAGVWVGNANNAPMVGSTGAMTSAPIWQAFMRRALEGAPVRQFVRPENVVEQTLCVPVVAPLTTPTAAPTPGGTPQAAPPSCVSRRDLFVRGRQPTSPPAPDFEIVKVKVDRRNGLLAADDTPAEFVEEKAFVDVPEAARDWAEEYARRIGASVGVPTERSSLGRATPTPSATPRTAPGTQPGAAGPCAVECVVPNVVGMPEAEGKRLLETVGLATSYSNYQREADVADKNAYRSVPRGAILSQSIAPGTRVPRGTLVNVAVRLE